MAIKMNKYFALCVLFLLSFNLQFGITYKHEKPVAKSIWKEPCTQHSRILNDCNWCRCSNQKRYTCDARVCAEVDMFGHFNDAIKELDVGMEGHGVWRTDQTACKPGVQYQRGMLLCVCTEDGEWPSPICRDTFRILHPVEIVTNVKTFKDQQCTPAKLYLIGCNVCFCPADGVPNPKFCTRKTCSEADPVFNTPKDIEEVEISEVYAQCHLDTKYKLGCKSCICLRNNRLLCDNCTSEASHCSNKEPGEVFKMDCNTCQCDERGLIYCTVKKCIKSHAHSKDIIDETELESVDPPIHDIHCIEGTKYKRDCNICYCYRRYGIKKFGCTLNKCSGDNYLNNCVDGAIYKMNCLICQCGVFNGNKMQICHEDPKCKKQVSQELQSLADLSGYCEPLHFYKRDCNTCECLPDGKTIRCTAKLCEKSLASVQFKSKPQYNPIPVQNQPITKPIIVEIVPVVKDIGHCTRGSTFKIDCNICFCLSNGDVVCTTENCRKRN